jgi:hypothetical protein
MHIPSWFMAAEVILKGLSNVDEFWGSEVPVYYSGLYAGTTDCVGVERQACYHGFQAK